jgi:CDP-2,3-bis-(O-geranylgeranyl)-sn-glycerol synthase
LFGDHKTWRGLFAGTAAGATLAVWMDLPMSTGAAFAFASLTGDALSSALKRRFDLTPGTEVFGFDQLGETALPLLLLASPLDLSFIEGVLAGALFAILDLACAPLRASPKSSQE